MASALGFTVVLEIYLQESQETAVSAVSCLL